MSQSVSVLGCGWLGLPLAKSLVANGFDVKGSTTSRDKLSILKSELIQPFLVEANPDIQGTDAEEFFNCDLVIFNIPPDRDQNLQYHLIQIDSLMENLSPKTKIIFISSTSVYKNRNKIVTESDEPDAETGNGKILKETETKLIKHLKNRVTIIRFGGLIGEDRNPVKYFAGRVNIPDPDSPVNLIHLKDCIGIILKVIKENYWGKLLNAVTPDHPTRKEYYTFAAEKLGMEKPLFGENQNPYKIVNSIRITNELNYNFIFSSPINWHK